MSDININGITVNFPFEPYEVQKIYMSKVIECLQNKKHGVLESPTGTGKTLCLLCSSLSWLTAKKAQLQAQALIGAVEVPNFGGKFFEKLKNELDTAAGASGSINPNSMFGWASPKIIYASRTHTQLTQVMQELKRTSYKHLKVAVIGSRDQLCIHPEVSKEQNSADKIHLCQCKVRSRTCMYYNNVELRKDDPIFREEICDIEDLVKAGNKVKCCPYFLARELKQNADITFMPYNYLLDPKTRRSQGVDLQNQVILLDEAHNVEKTCEDAASLQISSTDIALCIDEITSVMKTMSEEETNNEIDFNFDSSNDVQKDFTPEDLCLLKSIFLAFEKAIDDIILKKNDGETFPGGYIFELMEKAEITHGNESHVIEKLDKIILWLSTTSTSPFARNGRALQKFSDFLRTVFSGGSGLSAINHRERVKDCYKVYVSSEDNSKNPKNSGWNSKNVSKKSEGKIISYWCFSPGFGMRQIVELGVHSIILTSGTLSPLQPFITELGIPIEVQLENPHIVKPDQVCVGILSQGPDGHQLNSSYNTRNDPKYISTLGRTIYNFSCLIPDGLLVFFPSYPIMKKCHDDWQSTGLWSTIAQKKPIYVESQSKDGFGHVMNEFYKKIQDPAARGAIFLAVCRGKVSEGLDFADANGRAVLITGLPYPPMMDPRVLLKQRYLDEMRLKDKQALSGQQWYQLEASRAVNQAVGRIIRHINDYGAIILCDCRFNNANFKQHLSAWLRPCVKNFSNFGMVTKQLRDFFKNAEKLPQPKKRFYEMSISAIGASFGTNTKQLDSSSLKKEKEINIVESFNVNSYKILSQKNEHGEKIISSEIDCINKSAINLVTSKVKGTWSETTWKATKEIVDESIAKKRKLKVQPLEINYNAAESSLANTDSNKNNEDKKSVKNQSKKEIGELYLKSVKRALSKEDFQIFAKLVEIYKKNGDIEELLKTLEKLFPISSSFRHLFLGFKTFLKKQHIEHFEKYVNGLEKK
ncbi:hypothetical protein PV325_000708 [Microctonus aethiopoides]|uniref:Regulator of telomere elongation helicase 1 homolog n=1 Tax=Microctonus aethiopoides TaxID=144406 RepID=A0AA39EZT7_9HYME|nr:hypothetical protein PV325_000708 [Microctonus aethiopoides]KAK0158911.1 hypothetical protein PV328_009849 [Microctonus aethiopoides]